MKALAFERRLRLCGMPVVGVGLLVVALAALLAGSSAGWIAAAGLAVSLMVLAIAEGVAELSRVENPVFRMLLTMGVRAGLAAIAIVVGVKASGVDPRTIVLIALPLYLSLVAGEALVAGSLPAAGLRPTRQEG